MDATLDCPRGVRLAHIVKLLVVLGVELHVGLELLVPHQRHVGGQHHQRLARLVLVLRRAIPLLFVPARMAATTCQGTPKMTALFMAWL